MKGEIRSKQDNQTTSQSLPTCFVMKHHELSRVSKKWLNCIPVTRTNAAEGTSFL